MTFDASQFLNVTISTSNATKSIPVPMGEYHAVLEKVEPRQWQSKDGSKSGISLDVTWIIEDQGVKDFLGRESVTCRQGVMLDLTPDGAIDTSAGRNIALGRLREAVGLNQAGQDFSFHMLPGKMAKVSISHRVQNEDTFAEVKAVAAI